MPADVTYTIKDNLVLLVHSKSAPADDEWRRYVDEFRSRQHALEDLRVLVITDGGGPDAKQRGWLNEVVGGRNMPTAVVSAASIPRVMVKALSFFNPRIRAFAPHELSEALAYLGIAGSKADWVAREVERLKSQLG